MCSLLLWSSWSSPHSEGKQYVVSQILSIDNIGLSVPGNGLGAQCLSYFIAEPPTGVMAEAVGARGIRVTWLPFDTSCITSIRVSFTPGGLSVPVRSWATEFSAESGLTCNTAYTVTVRAITTGVDEASSHKSQVKE